MHGHRDVHNEPHVSVAQYLYTALGWRCIPLLQAPLRRVRMELFPYMCKRALVPLVARDRTEEHAETHGPELCHAIGATAPSI